MNIHIHWKKSEMELLLQILNTDNENGKWSKKDNVTENMKISAITEFLRFYKQPLNLYWRLTNVEVAII